MEYATGSVLSDAPMDMEVKPAAMQSLSLAVDNKHRDSNEIQNMLYRLIIRWVSQGLFAKQVFCISTEPCPQTEHFHWVLSAFKTSALFHMGRKHWNVSPIKLLEYYIHV